MTRHVIVCYCDRYDTGCHQEQNAGKGSFMTETGPSNDVWVLGATGRVGHAVATELAAAGFVPVLVGRNGESLRRVAEDLGTASRVVLSGSLEEMADEIRQQRPAVVVNTVGPFARTAPLIARACLSSSHYVDLANDVTSVSALLELHDEAVAGGRILVTGSGFGVLATESVVSTLCRDRPSPHHVRVDALPSVALEAGAFGEALAATIIDGLPEGGVATRTDASFGAVSAVTPWNSRGRTARRSRPPASQRGN